MTQALHTVGNTEPSRLTSIAAERGRRSRVFRAQTELSGTQQSKMDKREADPEYGADDDDVDVNRTEDADAPDAETEEDVPDVSDEEEDLDDEVGKCMRIAPLPLAPTGIFPNILLNGPCTLPRAGQPRGELGQTRHCEGREGATPAAGKAEEGPAGEDEN